MRRISIVIGMIVLMVSCGRDPNNPIYPGSGLYLYVSNYTSGTISFIEVDPTDYTLSAIESYTAGSQLLDLAISRDEKCLFAASRGDDKVVAYSIDPIDGKLIWADEKPSGDESTSVAAHGSLDQIYVSAFGSTDEIYVFNYDSNCELTQSGSTLTTNINTPWKLRVYGNYLMITDTANNGVVFYDISTTTPSYITINFLGASTTDFVYTGSGTTYNIYGNGPLADALALGLFDGSTLSWPGFINESVDEQPDYLELYDSDTILISATAEKSIMAFELDSTTGAYSSKHSMPLPGIGPQQLNVLGDTLFFASAGNNKAYSYRYDPINHTLTAISEVNVGEVPFRSALLNLND